MTKILMQEGRVITGDDILHMKIELEKARQQEECKKIKYWIQKVETFILDLFGK